MSVLVHIGHMKTATTTLQYQFFREENGYSLIGDRWFLRQKLVYPTELEYEESGVREKLLEEGQRCKSNGLHPVLSFERLAGGINTGGVDSLILLRRIKRIFPDALILIVFREQRQFLLSSYRNLIRQGFAYGLKEFLQPYTGPGNLSFRPSFLEYSKLINAYRQEFGEGKVLALPYELLREKENDFTCRISNFAGVDLPVQPLKNRANESRRESELVVLRRLNRIFCRSQNNPHGWLENPKIADCIARLFRQAPRFVDEAIRRRWERMIARFCEGRYSEDNMALSSMIGVNLEARGYEVRSSGRESSQRSL